MHEPILKYYEVRFSNGLDAMNAVVRIERAHDAHTNSAAMATPLRPVVWSFDSPSATPNGSARSLYVSEGTLVIARRLGIRMRIVGLAAPHELPEKRELLLGDPQVDVTPGVTRDAASVTAQEGRRRTPTAPPR